MTCPTVPAVGSLVRFREDFGPVGAARCLFYVDSEARTEDASYGNGSPLFVGLVTADQRRKGHRLGYVRDLVEVQTEEVDGTAIVEGDVVYMAGHFQRLSAVVQYGDSFHYRTPRSGEFGGVARATSRYVRVVD